MLEQRAVYLGVDGGGTKTAFCLIDQFGTQIAATQAPSIYYFTEGIDLVERVLCQGVSSICEQAGISAQDIDYAFFGLPSYGEVSNDVALLDAVPAAVLGHDRYKCDNDMVCGWAGSLAAADGINVISGTGAMTYGEIRGCRARVGGWGELFGDEGSAYWIAIRGLTAFSKMSDGRLPAGPLQGILREHLDLTADLDIVDVVLNRWQGARSEIAALSPLVVGAAEQGDSCASAILAEAGRELAEIVDTTRHRLDFAPDATVPVSYSGGVFSANRVFESFREELGALYRGYELREPLYEPVLGAALYAARLAGKSLNDSALERLRVSRKQGSANAG